MIHRCPADLPDHDATPLPDDAVIAVDGPAGSGKSTTARALAERFGLLYIDTGAMYRSLTLAALRNGIAPDDGPALAALLDGVRLELKTAEGGVGVFWEGRDVSGDIRSAAVDAAVSRVAAHDEVRRDMVRRQQVLGRRGGVVMEGRDIGSVVFPLATAKIFLGASLEARVERRYRQIRQRGEEASREQLATDLAERDRLDSERATSPLIISPDAIVIDSSEMSLAQQNEACARACLVNTSLDHELDADKATALLEIPWHYRLAYTVFRGLARFYGQREVGNGGNALPRGVVVAVNHVSFWDPPLVGATFYRHPVHTLAKEELFRPNWFLGRILRGIDSIPIRRRGYDKEAFTAAEAYLTAGHNLLIFPEGTRRAVGNPGPVKNGLGILIQATRAPLLTIYLRGSYGRQPGGSLESPMEARFGPIIRWHALDVLLEELTPKEVSRRIGDLCEAAWRELMERSYVDHPRTAFERQLGEKQGHTFRARQERLFGVEEAAADS